jgi:hypothetical protein
VGLNFSGIHRGNLAGRLLRAPLELLPKGLTVRVLQGPARGMKWVVGSGTHGCWLGSYEYSKQRLLRRLIRPGDVVYDVGANVGFYTLLLLRELGYRLASLDSRPHGRTDEVIATP